METARCITLLGLQAYRYRAIVGVTAALVGFGACGPNSDGSKSREVERLERTAPVFPGMAETQETRVSKGTVASIHRYYRSQEMYDEVKKFYMNELTGSAWVFVGERSVEDWGRDLGGRELKFERDGFYVVVFYFR